MARFNYGGWKDLPLSISHRLVHIIKPEFIVIMILTFLTNIQQFKC